MTTTNQPTTSSEILTKAAALCSSTAESTVNVDQAVIGSLSSFPVLCRLVTADLHVAWKSEALRTLVGDTPSDTCCESLGLVHHECDCATLAAISRREPRTRVCWIGPLYVSVESQPVFNESGSVVGSFEWIRDITNEKKIAQAYAEQQDILELVNKAVIETNHHLEAAQAELEEKNRSLEQVNAQLQTLDRLKDEFISIVSHELKAPLTSIKASVDLVLRNPAINTDNPTRELLTICQRNADRLTRLVLDLLDVARIESGLISLSLDSFDLSEVIRDAIDSVRVNAESKGVALQSELTTKLPIHADRDRLHQVLVNLLSNAVKFTDHGSVTVRAWIEGDVVICEVEDTGSGIPESEFENVFNKFTQVNGAMSRAKGGTGLGLSIVRGIIREHGGDVSLRSTVGRGTCFSFRIPQSMKS